MPGFDLSEEDVDKVMGKIKKRKALTLDLRGNGGGLILTLQRLVGDLKVMPPTAADIAARRDPVLAHAAPLVGLNMDAEKAGALFPIEWKK
ncbi:MAG TPA: hypothetical protein VD861_00640 [Pyrinomonadaceae bacterium]|nr:hypothetical protein [Pyrinomonadaceae bacterium]